MSHSSKDPGQCLDELLTVMRTLRSPDGCPWDRKQTHDSLKKYAMEECVEMMDAIDENDPMHVKEELGDLLMHIVLHSVIAEEQGHFNLSDVVDSVKAKMIRRHPHVFGNEKISDISEVPALWEKVKQEERKNESEKSILARIPKNHAALIRAHRVGEKASEHGFDWTSVPEVMLKIEEEWAELQCAIKNNDEENIDEEIGDMIFVLTSLARIRKRDDAETLLHQTIKKFERRFGFIEKQLKERDQLFEDVTLDEMEALWQEAKKLEK